MGEWARFAAEVRQHVKVAQRVRDLPPFLFAEISRKIAAKRAQGRDVINLSIGDPDLPPPAHVVERLCEAVRSPGGHVYPESNGEPALRRAMAGWYRQRFGVELDPDREVLPLIGSKEGVGHLGLCLLEPGDVALLPDPAYGTNFSGTVLAGGEPYYLPLLEENDYLPDLAAVPADMARRAGVLWLNYPNNPTAAVAPPAFFGRVVDFAREYDITVLHDAPYTEIAYDGYRPCSFLETKGAREVGIELHSLSKSFSMQGYRVGMAVGNAQIVGALTRLKSHVDSGIPGPIQQAAIAALEGPQDVTVENSRVYQRRRDQIVATLTRLGLRVSPPKASLYVWAPVPDGHTSVTFTNLLLDEADVVVTPGSGFGAHGEGYVRISVTVPDHRLTEALARLESLGERARVAPAGRAAP